MTTTRGYTILGWLVWKIGSRIAQRKMGQKMAENRLKLGLAGAVLLVVVGILAAVAARSRRSAGGEPAPAAPAATSSETEAPATSERADPGRAPDTETETFRDAE